ncbi:YncE family protein [Williamsia sterculiae]|uniref:Uncharacterized protein n=1 Tax=Williamsia sterculiae TaxID=1344003 RepID=A0A1N7ELR1_9NOCA|nr:hypothetical protein [Williamsia sterculiae]SIR88989.1 hypothetical protein SAMN05445060_1444 [Williamsia sterculiae]
MRRFAVVCAAVLSMVLIAACGGGKSGNSPDVATVAPATAVAAPATSPGPAAGHTVAAPGFGSSLAVGDDRLAVLNTAGTRVSLLPTDRVRAASSLDTVVGAVTATLPSAATAMSDVRDGRVLLAGPHALMTLDVASGAVTSGDLPAGTPLSARWLPDGRAVIGTDTGHVVVVGVDGEVQHDISGLVRADDLAVHPRDGAAPQVLALDRAQSSVSAVDVDAGTMGLSLRAGNGATTLTVDHYGRFLVANTRDGELLGFAGDPMIMRFRFPVAGGPYAVDYDDAHALAWVSSTGDSVARGYDLASGVPVLRHRLTTVSQADHMVVDPRDHSLYLLSANGAGVQVVTADEQANAAAFG